ncbi:hypothetical protein QFC22_005376 [Naganishia vaughanmartiniae]|uniref:Uncharacterized protein n=1 Tax=Naganishia vaughanmartiniae TaxID=1424756 RepID=A0ACC2WU68_9TREE|nr:hypothetical protein QFC22_005376 [Naganishia vaughanmartiniae]
MTRTPISTRTISDSEFYELCRILSHAQYQPTAVQVLYFLLQPIIQHSVQQPEDIGAALRRSHGDGVRVMTFGEVPTLAQLGKEAEKSKVWGVATLWTYDPENTAEESSVRGRFWISSETISTSVPSTHTAGNTERRWQPDDQSIHLLQTMCDTFFLPFLRTQQQNGSTSSIFFNGTNQCWTPTLATLGRKTYDGPCTKAARVVPLDISSEEGVLCPVGFRIRSLEERDVQTVSIRSPCRLSHCTNAIWHTTRPVGNRLE